MEMKMKIVKQLPSGEEIAIESASISYSQQCDDNFDGFQDLIVSTEEQGGGKYFVIKTERWAFNNIEEFVELLEDFKKRAGIE